jgi:hypothetical protein
MTEEDGSVETTTDQEQVAEDNGFQKLREQNENLSEKLEMLQTQMQNFVAAMTPQQKKEQGLTQAKIAEMRDDPAAIAQFIQSETQKAIGQITQDSKKQHWDRKAEEDFPALNTDKAFKQQVIQKMRELKANDGYTDDNPMLVYRAAELVGSKMAKVPAKSTSKDAFTSEEPSRGVTRGTTGQTKSKISDNDQRVVFAKLLGIKGDKLEKFKTQIPQEFTPQRKPARRLNRDESI